MTAQIFGCGGTVEKYIGDAILATFGVLGGDRAGRRAGSPMRCRNAGCSG